MDKETVNRLVKEYDTLLPFNMYLERILPEHSYPDNVSFKICCPLHEEKTPSFSYSRELGVWTCFGQCHTTGKVVKFHFLWLRKQYGNSITLIQALKSLYEMFPHILPPVEGDKFSYSTYNNTKHDKDIDKLVSEIKRPSKIQLKKTNTRLSLSEECLKIFIEKNNKGEYYDKD